LENRGWIQSEWGVSDNNRRAKFYELTTVGRKQLGVETANWERLSSAINLVLATG
jgi:DNA-binding PadR family transcriptional regulator